jgi:4-hydroxy-tetrahydrodipicolinate synthase
MSNTELHGVIVPVITPINDREEVDEAAFRKLLRWLIDAGVNGIFVGGSAGEGPLLVDAQWRRMVEIACDEVGGAIPLLGGAQEMSSRRVCEKVKILREIGYRHFVVTPTFYITVRTVDEHLRLFGQAKEAGQDMEMIPYNIPQCTGSALSLETMCELAKRGWARNCKESSGDWLYLKELIRRGKDVGLTVLAGDEPISDDALLAGAGGIVPVCANFEPALFLRLYEAGKRGDRGEMAGLMRRMEVLRESLLLSGPCWLTGIKYALSAMGMGSGQPISPLEPVDAKRKARIDALMEGRKVRSNHERHEFV